MFDLFPLYYVIVLSLVGFCSMGIDKWKAKHKKYRISEKTLHKKFSIGLPIILFLQILLVTLYCLSPILQK